jgi:hypothetical protein
MLTAVYLSYHWNKKGAKHSDGLELPALGIPSLTSLKKNKV